MEQKKLVIGLTGTLLAGKNTVAGILKSKGVHHIVLSSLIREELSKDNIPVTRASLQDMGNKLRKEHQGKVLAEMALAKSKSYNIPLIIDGIRNLDEINFLKENSNFFLIGIDAPFEVRWERLKKRNRDSDLLNHDRFVIDDARDRGFNEPLNGQQVGMCLVQADFLINNDQEIIGPIENSKLYRDVMEIYRKIMKR